MVEDEIEENQQQKLAKSDRVLTYVCVIMTCLTIAVGCTSTINRNIRINNQECFETLDYQILRK